MKGRPDKHTILESLRYWGIQAQKISLLKGSRNHVLRIEGKDSPSILRLSPIAHRSRLAVKAEAEWVLQLQQQGLSVCGPIPGLKGELALEVEGSQGKFIASVWEEAKGQQKVLNAHDWNLSLVQLAGNLLGNIHHQQPDNIKLAQSRPTWQEEPVLIRARDDQNSEAPIFRASLLELAEKLESLTTNTTNFGMIHGDFHAGNFFVSPEALNLFDFDNASWHWYSYDIATAIYHMLWTLPSSDRQVAGDLGKVLVQQFSHAYQQVRSLPDEFQTTLPLFIRYRRLLLANYYGFQYTGSLIPPGVKTFWTDLKEDLEQDRFFLELS